MKLWSIILLFGNYFFRWTTAVSFEYESYSITIEANILKNITVTSDTLNVDLSNFHIKQIKKNALDELTYIESLDLSRNELRELEPFTFSKLENLKMLSLARNKILHVLESRLFVGLKNLEALNLAHNQISHIVRSSFEGIPKSTNISIVGNPLQEITTEAFKQRKQVHRSGNASLKNLYGGSVEQYNLKICQNVEGIVESVGMIGMNESLDDCTRALETSHNGRNTIKLNEHSITGFKRGWYGQNLSHNSIDLSANFITEITKVVFNELPSGVSHIDLSINLILTIEDGAFEKFNLTTLDVSGNRLKSMAFIRTLPSSIKELNCGGNSISEMPPNLFHLLKNLEVLVMKDNYLKEIGSNVFEFQANLRLLDFSFNQIRRVESESFRDSEGSLKIDLSHNEIEDISRNTFNKEGLYELHLSFNKIENILCDTFSKNLNLLKLDSNKINGVEPGTFSDMHLRILDLSSNNITESRISNAFNGSSIEWFYFSHNSLTKIDREIFKTLSVLRLLRLANNPITRIENGAMINMKGITTLDLRGTQVTELNNGALFGLRTQRRASVLTSGMPLQTIQGGVFNEISSD